jgi:hypothetical protein
VIVRFYPKWLLLDGAIKRKKFSTKCTFSAKGVQSFDSLPQIRNVQTQGEVKRNEEKLENL